MAWYDKYMPFFGSPDNIPEEIYEQTRQKLAALEKGPIEVSVVVIARNEEQKILPTLMSLADLATNRSTEVIVVDNGSTDRTPEIVERAGARLVLQPKAGHGNARQAGMEAARGKYLFSADSDTLYRPTYIDTMLRGLEKEGVSAVFSICGFYPDGKRSRFQLAVYEWMRNMVTRLRAINRPELTAGGASMAFRTADGLKYGYRTHILRGEDGAMLLELKKEGKPCFVRSRKARIATSSRRLDLAGSFWEMVWQRAKREIKRAKSLMVKQEHYADQESNLRKD